MKLKLVEDWRRGWRWISVNCIAVVVAVQGAVGRFIKQESGDADKPAE